MYKKNTRPAATNCRFCILTERVLVQTTKINISQTLRKQFTNIRTI